MAVLWNFPTRILYGEGSAAETGPQARRFGGTRALIVSDEGVVDSGLVEDVEKSLRRAKMPFEVFSDVSSNPVERQVLSAAETYRRTGADFVVAMGGGSAIDVGKLASLLVSHDPPLDQYDADRDGEEHITRPTPPMLALPTTAGSGSEVARSAVATLDATRRKTMFRSDRLMPDVAILDPGLTTTMPPETTAATGFDAIARNIEAYCAQGDHPMADAIALEGLQLGSASLPRAYEQGDDMQARGTMLKAAMMSGVAFQKGLGACQALSHALSAECGLHHGIASALCLPAVLDFNRSALPDRIARLARILGVRGDDRETLAFECSGAIRALRRKVGLAQGLGDTGVSEDMLDRLARRAIDDRSHATNPRECTKEDMLALYRSSL